jgi:hypothetical protein
MSQPAAPRKIRRLNRFIAFALLCLLTPIFVFGATVAATGFVHVSVQERGPDGANIFVPVPAILFDVALFAVPRIVPPQEMAGARAEIEPFLPALNQLADELENLPNATLVEVKSPTEHVKISKRFGSFYIEVHDQDADVSVKVPSRLISGALTLFG